MVPVYQGDASEAGGIAIDPVTVQNMGVRTEPVKRRDLMRTIRTVGLVAYEDQSRFSINSKIEGWIERLYVNQVGQFVKKGQPLMAIYSPELVAAQQEYLLALDASTRLEQSALPAAADAARRLLEAARTRLSYWDISEAQIRELKGTREVRKHLTLYSQYQGVVTMKKANQGMRVMGGEELLQISDISNVWVNANIYEYELAWVQPGQPAKVEVASLPGKVLMGKIAYIYPYLQAETRTVKARIELSNPGFALKPDMYANVVIEGRPVTDALAIPGNAVLRSGEGQTVFVALGEGRFEPRKVKIGLSGEQGYVQVLSGLKEDETVVTSAQFMLDSESKISEAVQKMMAVQTESAPAEADHEGHAMPADNEDLFK
jgi:Cu(I)/Ag(I) efflux system membrane fusion protein/cobalt-zinc-cadmium efflux system membrane fusion protein